LASEKLMNLLNQSIARELAVSIQYMWHHIMAVGIENPAVTDIFKKIAIIEMKHAEKIAERLDYLGGVPTTKPSEIKVGGDLKKMLKDDLEAEKEAITLYRQVIKVAEEEGDIVTRRLFEEILADEEEHENTFKTLLGE